MTQLVPRQPVPELDVALVGGGRWRLGDQNPKMFTMIVVYRGHHCPLCRTYLRDLDRRSVHFRDRGIEPMVLSTDPEDRARRTRAEWGIDTLPLGFGLTIEAARGWGLFISSGRGMTSAGVEEPALFVEPGLFLVRPDGTLYASSIQTMPFVRPSFNELSKALDTIIERDYPARGEA